MKKQKLIATVALTTLLSTLFSGCAVKMAVPEVTEGRFDFSVTYEVNGEQTTYTGVYVCKYDGIQVALDGKARMWDSYIEGNENAREIAIQTNDDGVIYIDFNFNPQYFMSDPASINFDIPEPSLLIIYKSENPDEVSFGRELDFMADYGVQIIGYEYADPIANNYEETWSFARFY